VPAEPPHDELSDQLSDDELHQVEHAVGRALDTDDHRELRVLGYGEVSVAVGWPAEVPRWACKRLPPFADESAYRHYAGLVNEYVTRLRAAGVAMLDTDARSIRRADGSVVGYLVQPVLPSDDLGPAVLRGADPADGHPLVGAIVDSVLACTDGRTGIDAQLTNWAWLDGRAVNMDVTTPFMWDEQGRSLLDIDLFLGALPWIVRASQRRAAPKILRRWSEPRWSILDFAMNLYKDDLAEWIPAVLDTANPRLDSAIDAEELRSRYRKEAALWVKMHRLKRLDRAWQRKVRRRRYEFLVPERTDYA
jgi:hypothetical protein